MNWLARLLSFLGVRWEAGAQPPAPPQVLPSRPLLVPMPPVAPPRPPVHAIGDPGWGEDRLILPGHPDPAPMPAPVPILEVPMALPFAGAGRRLTSIDIARAAAAMRVEVAVIEAVRTVEAGAAGGFLPDGSGRPQILFEAHRFARETGGRFNKTHPTLSVLSWDRTLYLGGAREYARLLAAVELDRPAALKATSWGLFQILGSNHLLAGYPDVESYVAAMLESEGAHLDAFVSFCRENHLDIHLQARNWAAFARGYNGTAYAQNAYDVKLAAAYAAAKGLTTTASTVIRIGAQGQAVTELQRALAKAGFSVTVDGIFGRGTDVVVQQFQQACGLKPDGIVGPSTWKALKSQASGFNHSR